MSNDHRPLRLPAYARHLAALDAVVKSAAHGVEVQL